MKIMKPKQWYIGYVSFTKGFEAFRSEVNPTPDTHGTGSGRKPPILYVVGPFRTKRGAKWAEKYGHNNPHFTGVAAAEAFARQEKAESREQK